MNKTETHKYIKTPVDIETFIKDPYYLGNILNGDFIYPYWIEKLKELYPDPYTCSNRIVILDAGLGVGKSTFIRLCTLYNIYLLSCTNFEFDIDIKFFGLNRDFYDTNIIEHWMEISEYFKNLPEEIKSLIHITSEDSNNKIMQYNFSNLQFVKEPLIELKLKAALEDDCMIFIELVPRTIRKVFQELLKAYCDEILIINDPLWIIKGHLDFYKLSRDREGNNSFKVYLEEDLISSYIVSEDHPLPKNFDENRLLEVPLVFLNEFRFNLITALNDIAGIPKLNL